MFDIDGAGSVGGGGVPPGGGSPPLPEDDVINVPLEDVFWFPARSTDMTR